MAIVVVAAIAAQAARHAALVAAPVVAAVKDRGLLDFGMESTKAARMAGGLLTDTCPVPLTACRSARGNFLRRLPNARMLPLNLMNCYRRAA